MSTSWPRRFRRRERKSQISWWSSTNSIVAMSVLRCAVRAVVTGARSRWNPAQEPQYRGGCVLRRVDDLLHVAVETATLLGCELVRAQRDDRHVAVVRSLAQLAYQRKCIGPAHVE